MVGHSSTLFASLLICSIFYSGEPLPTSRELCLFAYDGAFSYEYYNFTQKLFDDYLDSYLEHWSKSFADHPRDKTAVGGKHTLVLFIEGHEPFDKIYSRKTPDELANCMKVLQDATADVSQKFDKIIIVKSINRDEENRRAFFTKIQSFFKDAIYIPIKGVQPLPSDNSPLVIPAKAAFEAYLPTV